MPKMITQTQVHHSFCEWKRYAALQSLHKNKRNFKEQKRAKFWKLFFKKQYEEFSKMLTTNDICKNDVRPLDTVKKNEEVDTIEYDMDTSMDDIVIEL